MKNLYVLFSAYDGDTNIEVGPFEKVIFESNILVDEENNVIATYGRDVWELPAGSQWLSMEIISD